MAHPLISTNPPQGGEEGAPLQSLLRGKTFRPQEESPLAALLGQPARLHDPGKPREKTADDIIGVTYEGRFLPAKEFLDELLAQYGAWFKKKGRSRQEILNRLAKHLCPICENPNCKWFTYNQVHFKE